MIVNNKLYKLDFTKLASFLIIFVILTYILIVGKDILVPVVFGVLLAFMLRPVCNFYEGIIKNHTLAILLTFFTCLTPLIIAGWFFISQLQMVFNEMDDIISGISEGVDEVSYWLGSVFDMNRSETSEWITDGVDGAVAEPLTYITSGLASSTAVLINALLTIIYLFLFLFYRTAIKRFMMQQFSRKQKDDGEDLVYSIQQVSKKYFGGMLTVMLILGVLNSVGLYFIGLEFPFLWGFLAATLAIIPYIGTILGGALPFLYSFASGEGYWEPAQVLILYAVIQSLEGNFITPKVVGSSVNINPLAAIFALFVGEAIWGIAGMVVALPLLAILRIIMDHLDSWKPVALLLSDDFYKDSILYETKYEASRYRLTTIFFGDAVASTPKPPKNVSDTNPEVISKPKPKQRDPKPGGHK